MQNDRLYEAVFHRRSVRRYDMHPLPQDVLDGVLAAAHAATPLDPIPSTRQGPARRGSRSRISAPAAGTATGGGVSSAPP